MTLNTLSCILGENMVIDEMESDEMLVNKMVVGEKVID